MDRITRLNFHQRKQELEMERLRVGTIQTEIEVDQILFKRYGKTRDELTQDQVWEAWTEMRDHHAGNPRGAVATAWFITKLILVFLALGAITTFIRGGIQSIVELIAEDNLFGEISLSSLIILVLTQITKKKKSV